MRHKIHVLILMIGYSIVMTTTIVNGWSPETGRVRGRVIDAETGKLLEGLAVVLPGTILGSLTDKDGYYCIGGVPPGNYRICSTKKIEDQCDIPTPVAKDTTFYCYVEWYDSCCYDVSINIGKEDTIDFYLCKDTASSLISVAVRCRSLLHQTQ